MRTEHTPWMGVAVSAVLLLLLPLLSSAVDVPPVELTPGSSSNLRQQQQSGRNRTRIEQETGGFEVTRSGTRAQKTSRRPWIL